jgi:hypothetical protein
MTPTTSYHQSLTALFARFDVPYNPTNAQLDAIPHEKLSAFQDLLVTIIRAGQGGHSEYSINPATLNTTRAFTSRLKAHGLRREVLSMLHGFGLPTPTP